MMGGVYQILEMVTQFFQGHVHLDLGVLELFVGLGLLRLSKGWRIMGLVLLGVGLTLGPFFLWVLFTGVGQLESEVLGMSMEGLDREWIVL